MDPLYRHLDISDLPVSALPKCFAIAIRLSHRPGDVAFLCLEGGQPKQGDYLTFRKIMPRSQELKSSTHTRFYIDPSKVHPGLVHVRCGYNNKYLVAKKVERRDRQGRYVLPPFDEEWDGTHNPEAKLPLPEEAYFFDMADEPVEDLESPPQNKERRGQQHSPPPPPCTLLSVLAVSRDRPFLDVERQYGPHHRICFAGPQSSLVLVGFLIGEENLSSFQVLLFDMSEQIILPPSVVFKMTDKEKEDSLYLKVCGDKKDDLQFITSKDRGDKSARFMTYNYADGTVRFKSEVNDKFLMIVDNTNHIIKAEGPQPSLRIHMNNEGYRQEENIFEPGTLFKVLKYGNFFALQTVNDYSTGGGTFCARSDTGSLVAGFDSITENTKIILEEPVLRREIYNVQYHLNHHSRVFDTHDMSLAIASAVNRTSQNNTVKSSISITTTESKKWEATSTHNLGVQVTASMELSIGIVNMGVQTQYGYQYTRTDNWATNSDSEKKQDIEYEVTVPANKKVTLSVTATQAKYDVPFSYTQKDTLFSGEVVVRNLDDGLYRGMNCFNLRYETVEEDITIPSDPTSENPQK